MPVYDGEQFVDEAIASVLEQDFTDFEFVIVDDGSKDTTPAILQRWAERDPRIVVVRAPKNAGIAASLNRGLAVARGRYVARQDADDLCLRNRLRRQVELLDAEPDVVLVSAGYHLIDSSGRSLGTELRTEPPEVVAYLLHFSNAIGGHGQVMFRRDVVIAAGGYCEDFELAEDYDLWTRLSRLGRIVLLPIIGMKHRLHDQRASVLWTERQRRHSLSISRRMMRGLLQREITREEEEAVSSVWVQEGQTGVAALAQSVLREAYGRYLETQPRGVHRRRVRFATARRWVLASATLARRRQIIDAFRHLGYALRWHPLGVISGGVHYLRRAILHFRRATHRARVRARYAYSSLL
jgi:glycosyltransferase involved in cell wall biosynthesis